MNIINNFACKTDYVAKDGTIPLSYRVTINGKPDYVKLGRRIHLDHYDKDANWVKKGIKGHTNLVSYIRAEGKKIDDLIEAMTKQGQVITHAKIKKAYKEDSGKVTLPDFYTYVENELERERRETEIKESTASRIEMEMERIQKFTPRLEIHEIDEEWLGRFNEYLIGKYAYNSRYNTLSTVRKYVLRLYKSGIIKKYPFATFEIGQPEIVDIVYLEPEELSQLHDLFDSGTLKDYIKKATNKHAQDFHVGARYQNVLHYLLVACYSGLRHSDIKTLKKEHIQGGFIVKPMEKDRMGRKKTVRIPIRKRLRSLLNMESETGYLFDLPVNETSATNKYIREILKIAGINKQLTFHGCRHTFAIISLLLGVKLEVVSDVLGHSEITTTQRYAKVVDRLRDKEMDKWDDFSSDAATDLIHQKIMASLSNLNATDAQKVLQFIQDLEISSSQETK